MKIYEHELKDNLTLSNYTTADCSIVSSSDFNGDMTESLAKTIAKYCPSNPNQIDLHYLTCVLVSLGWNKNDDVFDKSEVLASWKSPEDKPFNYMHDESDIIGHITGNIIVDKQGQVISPSLSIEEMPDEIDVVTSAVIYKAWSDVEQLVRIREIISEIENNQWCVSMECLFRNFDYSVVSPDGTQRIVARNEESAFLTKHLRAYGGSGKYEDYKIGRLLRNITFSGIGLVKNPANPRSIILNTNNSLGENLMADTVAKTAASEDAKDESVKITDLENQVKTLSEAKASLENEKTNLIAEKDVKIASLEKEVAGYKEESLSMTEQLKAMRKELTNIKRRAVLASMNLDEDSIMDLLNKFEGMEDESFSNVVSAMKKVAMTDAKVKCDEQTEEVEEETEAEETEVEVETETETDVSIADAGDLESDTVKAQAALSGWFESNVLKTTKSLTQNK